MAGPQPEQDLPGLVRAHGRGCRCGRGCGRGRGYSRGCRCGWGRRGGLGNLRGWCCHAGPHISRAGVWHGSRGKHVFWFFLFFLKRCEFARRAGQRVFKTGRIEVSAAQPRMRGRLGDSLLGGRGEFLRLERHCAGFLGIALAFQASQLEHGPVQLHQSFKKRRALARVAPEQFQPRVQLAQQARDHVDQLGRLLERDLALDAPDQIGHHRAKAHRVHLVVDVDQPGMGHRQRPRAKQKVKDQAGHLVKVRARAHVVGNLVGLGLAFFRKTQRLQHLGALLRLQLVLLVPAVLQGGQGHAKRLRIFNREAVQFIEGARHRSEKSRELGAELVVVLEAALRHAFHQAPTGVALVAEKTWINHGQAQQGRLQRHNGFTHRRQQARVLRHLVHQLAHHLQAQHLPHALGFFLELGAHDGAFPGPPIGTPYLRAQLAFFIHNTRRAVRRGHVLVVGLRHAAWFCQRSHGRVGGRFQGRQLFLDRRVVGRRQSLMGIAVAPPQKVAESLIQQFVIGQVGVLRGLPAHRLVGHVTARTTVASAAAAAAITAQRAEA